MPRYALLFLLLFGWLLATAQSAGPYHFGTGRELAFGGAGALTIGIGTILQNNLAEPLRSELSVPFYEDINGFDRLGFNEEQGNARKISDYGLNFGAGLSAAFLLNRRTRRDIFRISLLYAETMALVGGITNVTKASFGRARPYVYGSNWDPAEPLRSGDRASFLSGHTSLSAAGSFFFARVFADYFPESRLRPFVWGLAALVPATTGYLRIRAARHFPTDVLAGYALGASLGILVPALHRRPVKDRRLSLAMSGSGFLVRYRLR